jgi:hypothetical protein
MSRDSRKWCRNDNSIPFHSQSEEKSEVFQTFEEEVESDEKCLIE